MRRVIRGVLGVGFENYVQGGRVLAILDMRSRSAPLLRIVRTAEEQGRCIDVTCGRRSRSVVLMDTGHVILSAREAEALVKGLSAQMATPDDTQDGCPGGRRAEC